MEKMEVARELVAMARELTSKDKMEVAHDLIMGYQNLIKMLDDHVSDIADEFNRAKRTEEGMLKSGGGRTEAQELLLKPLAKAKNLAALVEKVIENLEGAVR